MEDNRVGVLIAMLAVAAILSAACGDDGEEPAPTRPLSTETVATPLSPPYFEMAPLVEVTGLFTDPRDPPATTLYALPEAPPSPFQPVDRTSTVVYDVESMTETNLGPGNNGLFNADSTHMVWLSGPAGSQTLEAMLLDLRTMERQSLGLARSACWKDGHTVALRPPRMYATAAPNRAPPTEFGPGTLVDVNTGAHTRADFVTCTQRFDLVITPDGYELRQEYLRDTPSQVSTWYLTNPATGQLLLNVEAYRAVPAGPGWVAAATEVQLAGPADETGFPSGTTNVFLIEIATGKATFIATSRWNYANWPLTADDRHVAWTDAYCGQPQGTTKVLDRQTGEIADLRQPLWVDDFTDDGQLAVGAFGAKALIELDTLEYRAVLPAGTEPQWSPDWRYASAGLALGHGGLCP